jgi:hypothetical protein
LRFKHIADRLNRLTDAYLDQAIERALFEERKAVLLFERQEAEEALQHLKDPNASIPDALQKFLELAGDTYFLYQNALLSKKREMVKMTSSNLSVDQKRVDFAFAIPFREIANREKSDDGRPSQGLVRTSEMLLERLLAIIAASPAFELSIFD